MVFLLPLPSRGPGRGTGGRKVEVVEVVEEVVVMEDISSRLTSVWRGLCLGCVFVEGELTRLPRCYDTASSSGEANS